MNVSMGEKSNEIIQFRERKLTAASKLQKQQQKWKHDMHFGFMCD